MIKDKKAIDGQVDRDSKLKKKKANTKVTKFNMANT